MNCLSPVDGNEYRYSHIVGTGGIGSGIFFSLDGNHTLGRNESRLGKLLSFKDYCKLHIITHYIAVLLGAGREGGFGVFPIAGVGDDDTGRRLIDEIKSVGMQADHIKSIEGCSTLFSVCFQYPDKTGGNITTSESASNKVSPEDITLFFNSFGKNEGKELILAVPEVPVDTRVRLLEYGRERGSFNIASILSSEVDIFRSAQGFEKTDLLVVNIDEADNIAGIDNTADTGAVIYACTKKLTQINPGIAVLITDGPGGSYCCYGGYVEHIPSLEVEVVATAGAGDTFLAGTIAGLCCGLPITKGRSDAFFSQTPLISAVELGTMLAALAVTSPDAIHREADAALLYSFAVRLGVQFEDRFARLFEIKSKG